ncbi:uncharacterized protein LOC144629200 isoform X1 [Oculina patagonica]
MKCLQGTESLSMAALVRERVGIKQIGNKATVSDNPKAKLMYYLNSVAGVIDLNNPNLNRLRNYQNCFSLDEAETDALLAFVILLSPDKLIGKVFFHSEDLGDFANQFFELSAVSSMLAVTDNIVIGGETKRVAKIMFFERSWMENYYYTPIRSFQSRLERMARGLPGRAPSPPLALTPPRVHTPPSYRHNSAESCACNIL